VDAKSEGKEVVWFQEIKLGQYRLTAGFDERVSFPYAGRIVHFDRKESAVLPKDPSAIV
jgi:hypothetical protein